MTNNPTVTPRGALSSNPNRQAVKAHYLRPHASRWCWVSDRLQVATTSSWYFRSEDRPADSRRPRTSARCSDESPQRSEMDKLPVETSDGVRPVAIESAIRCGRD